MHARRVLILIVTGTVIILIATIAAFLVFRPVSPEDEIRRMVRAMSEVETARVRSAVSWAEGEGDARETVTQYSLGQVAPGAFPVTEYASRLRQFRVRRGERTEDGTVEMRAVGGAAYRRESGAGATTSGKWESVSLDSARGVAWGLGIGDGLAALFAGAPWPEGSAWTAGEVAAAWDAAARADVVVVERADVVVPGVSRSVRVMDVRLEEAALASLLLDMVRAREGREPSAEERAAATERAGALGRLSLRLWIGTNDHRLSRVQAAAAGQDPFDLILEFSEFDVPFEVEVPDALGSNEDGLKDAEAADGFSGGPSPADDVERLPAGESSESADTDSDGLSNLLEAFYLTDPSNPDTDADGTTDGEEVLAATNPRGTGTLFGFGLGEPAKETP